MNIAEVLKQADEYGEKYAAINNGVSVATVRRWKDERAGGEQTALEVETVKDDAKKKERKRPRRCTPQMKAEIVQYAEMHNCTMAAEKYDIDKSTVSKWLKDTCAKKEEENKNEIIVELKRRIRSTEEQLEQYRQLLTIAEGIANGRER